VSLSATRVTGVSHQTRTRTQLFVSCTVEVCDLHGYIVSRKGPAFKVLLSDCLNSGSLRANVMRYPKEVITKNCKEGFLDCIFSQ